MNKVGLISGNGMFPLIFAKKLVSTGTDVYICAFKGETDAKIKKYAKEINWIHVGQIKKIIKFFRNNNIDKAVMLGGIRKTRLFFDVRPDSLAIRALAGLKNTHDDNVLRMFASLLEKNGIKIVPSSDFMPELLAPYGIWTKKKPSDDKMKDIFLGFNTARKIGELDIGQTIVVCGGSIVAVEAVEGTDAAMKRGGELANREGVVVKVSKPFQDIRFDLPSIGPDTIYTMKESGLSVLAVEAGRTNVLDYEKVVSLANEFKMVVMAVDDSFFGEKSSDI